MKKISATLKGLLIAFVIIVVSLLLFYGLHLPENGKSQYITLGLFIAGMLWVTVDFKSTSTGNPGFKAYFSEGFKAFMPATLLLVIFAFFFYKFNPQILEKAISDNNALLIKEGNHTEAEIIDQANKLRSIFMPLILFVTTMKFLFLGALISVVSSGFLSQTQIADKK